MNRKQAIALAIATGNIIFIMLFPPFDVYSIATGRVPVFGGFDFYPHRNQYMVVNASVLILELVVVLTNAAIAWLLLGTKRNTIIRRRRISLQNATLVVVAINLVAVLLFPPFESIYAMTKATLPTFEGFYFIFTRQSNHVIVTPILYLEVIFLLISGALCWLIFRGKNHTAMTPEQMAELMQEMQQRGK